MTEVRHGTPQDPNTTPKVQHSGDLGLEQPFLNEAGQPAFGTGPINEDHLGDPAGILARLTPEQQQEVLHTAGIVFGVPAQESEQDRPPTGEHDSSLTSSDVNSQTRETANEEPFWTRRKKVVTAVSTAAALLVTGVAFGLTRAFGNNSPSTTPQPTPSAAAPANPTPSSSETTPSAPNLPFDSERVAIMQKETADEFLENNGEMLRIQYVLSQQYDQVEKSADYEAKLVKKLPNGKILSDYNSFKEISLTAEADPQDVMYSYLYGQLGAIARTDVDEGIKALSAVVKDPKSSLFTDLRTQVEKHTGAEADMSIITSRDYIALRAKRTTANDQTKLTIITEGGFQYEFVFKAVKGLEIANQNQKDDNKEVGVWLAESSKLGKVTIDF